MMQSICKNAWKTSRQPDHLLWMSLLLICFPWMTLIPLSSGQNPCPVVNGCTCYMPSSSEDPESPLSRNLLPHVTCVNPNATKIFPFFPQHLRSLIFANSWIGEIGEVHYYGMLQVVDLSGNRITEIKVADFVQNLQLRSVDLSRNRISTLQAGCFAPLKQLQVLILKENLIVHFDALHFMALGALETLDLSYNQLTVVDLIVPWNGSAPAAVHLSTLSLHHNPHLDSTSLFRQAALAVEMNGPDSNDSRPDSSPLPIQFLDLAFTAVSNVSLVLTHLPTVLSLNLSGCGVQQFRLEDVQAATHLREIVLRGNGIREIPFGGFRSGGGRRGLAMMVDVADNRDVRCECWMLHTDTDTDNASAVVWTGLDCISNPGMAAALRVLCEEERRRRLPSGVFLPLLVIIIILLLSCSLLTCFCWHRHKPDACRRWLRCTWLRSGRWRRRTGRKQPELMAFVAASSSVSSTPTMQSVSPTPEPHEPGHFIRANARTVVHGATDGQRISKGDESDEDSLYEVIGAARNGDYVNQQYIDAQNQPVTEL